jgi:hypothetical protein
MSMRRFESGRLVRLLLRRFFDLEFSGGLMNLALELITGSLELTEALAYSASEFRKLLGPEKQEHDDENKNYFRPTRHGQGKEWSDHLRLEYDGYPIDAI